MRLFPTLAALLAGFIVPASAAAQDDARTKRILDRVEKELAESRKRIREEIRAIIEAEIRKAAPKAVVPAPAPVKPSNNKKVRLGIIVEDFGEGERKKLGVRGGLKIAEVKEPAKSAGLRGGDVLLELDGTPVTEETILKTLGKYRPGDIAEATVLRDGKRRTFKLQLAERKE